MRQLWRLGVMTFVLVQGLATLLHAGVVTFDFEADGGKATTFTDTVGGLSATFISSGSPFVVAPSIFQTLTGNVLVTSSQAILTISFSTPLSSISMNFATFDTQMLTLTAFTGGPGGTPVGSPVSMSGTMPPGTSFPEGVLSFPTSGSFQFDTVALSSGTPSFAIDNVTVSSLAAPEPDSLLLCAAALASLLSVQFRRRIWTLVKPALAHRSQS